MIPATATSLRDLTVFAFANYYGHNTTTLRDLIIFALANYYGHNLISAFATEKVFQEFSALLLLLFQLLCFIVGNVLY